eukprot:scaffold840_cov344-Pavlova_lutheri.AAC.102
MFPTVVRNGAVGLCSQAARIGGIMAPAVIYMGTALDSTATYYVIFGLGTCTIDRGTAVGGQKATRFGYRADRRPSSTKDLHILRNCFECMEFNTRTCFLSSSNAAARIHPASSQTDPPDAKGSASHQPSARPAPPYLPARSARHSRHAEHLPIRGMARSPCRTWNVVHTVSLPWAKTAGTKNAAASNLVALSRMVVKNCKAARAAP